MQKHIPVLVDEVIAYLAPKANENFIDATVGFGGHAEKILLKTAPRGRLLAIDQDPVAVVEAKKHLKNYLNRVDFANVNFSELGLIIRDWEKTEISGILFDLGASTYQLTSEERGFSFRGDAPLDMRMSPKETLTAEKIINSWSFKELRKIFQDYGQEPNAGKIARAIVAQREKQPITTTGDLVSVIDKTVPKQFKKSKTHFATQTFQALRIATNNELDVLESGLKQALAILSPGGRIVVISFHSLEDRIVKNFFREYMSSLTPKPILATPKEASQNPRSRSAKLRAAIKI